MTTCTGYLVRDIALLRGPYIVSVGHELSVLDPRRVLGSQDMNGRGW
jgi:hypothetical protein